MRRDHSRHVFGCFLSHTLRNGRSEESRPWILWDLRGWFFEGFCNSPDHVVDVVYDASEFAELALLERS
jgi:hypothetical protein